jgi:hypothetical protein
MMQIDKQNGEVGFNEEKHIYFDLKNPEDKYISVTTLIGKFHQEFDAEFWSTYKAAERVLLNNGLRFKWDSLKKMMMRTRKVPSDIYEYYQVNREEFDLAKAMILDEWEKKKNEACDRGTKIHLEKELECIGTPEVRAQKLRLGGSFECNPDDYKLELERGLYPEFLISAKFGDLRIAGQIDLLVKDGNNITIADYKTNKEIKTHSHFNNYQQRYEMMKFPLHKLMDCNLMHYTMQLSTYAYLLKQHNPDFNIKELFLIHYDHDGNEKRYDLEYKEQEVKDMIREYKKTLALDERKENRKPLIYG